MAGQESVVSRVIRHIVPYQPVILVDPAPVLCRQARKRGGIQAAEVFQRQGRVPVQNVVNLLLALEEGIIECICPLMDIDGCTVLNEMLHEVQTFLQVLLDGDFLVRMGIVITAADIGTAHFQPVLLQREDIRHQSVVLRIAPPFGSSLPDELSGTQLREADGRNQVGIPFPVGLDDKPHVVKERHVCPGTAPAPGFLLTEEHDLEDIVFPQAFQTDEDAVLVIGPQVLESPL